MKQVANEKVKPQNPPGTGEHTMTELMALGYSVEDITALAEPKAVGLSR